jgi:hypothetical protein
LLIGPFIWDVVRNHSDRYKNMHGFAFISQGGRTYARPWDFVRFPEFRVHFARGTPRNFSGFLWICVPLRNALDFRGFAFILQGLPLGTSSDFLRFMARREHVWMQRPWIKVAMALKSNILPIAVRAQAQLAARGAHNPQAMGCHISSRRIHDAEL